MSATSTSRIWESPSEPSALNHSSRPAAQLPSIATLTNALPANGAASSPTYPLSNRDRDSDSHWPSQPQSTRSSAYSSGPNGYYYSSSINSPHRASNSSQLIGATSHPADYAPNSAGPHPSPGFAPPPPSLGLPALNQYHDGPQYRNSHEFPSQESRRSSLGSQVNTGFNNLHINGTISPYNSTNASQSSIAVSLQRERGISSTTSGIRSSRTSGSMQQTSPLNPNQYPGESRQAYGARTAPIISANPHKAVYNAEKPTAGQPYAFPDPEISARSSGSGDDPRSSSAVLSRRGSDHTSVSNSIYTSDSRLPPGQHRLDDGKLVLDDSEFTAKIRLPAEMSGTHHHSLQHKPVGSIAGESDSPDAASPYSRTPALRASHKMAERKRRTEMKFLFDGLRAQIPASHGSKSSKWEILSKASDYIKNLESAVKVGREAQSQLSNTSGELERTKREIESLRNENRRLFQEMEHYRESGRQQAPAAHPPPPQYAAPSIPGLPDPSRSLPPLVNGAPATTSMQGVQYSEVRH
ncbi:hypothetical protein MMC07_004814 [Pseudocyphellaria aurata]|nr:hypothetical protein [Pseudocyphellaria aurata]